MRVKALLSRAEMSGDKKSKGKVLKHADLTYSEDEHSVFADKTVVPLIKTEMSLLTFMMEEPQKTHSRDSMLDKIWGGVDEDTANDKNQTENSADVLMFGRAYPLHFACRRKRRCPEKP